jgi:protein TonB
LLPNQSCFSPAALTSAGVSTTRDAGVTAPELLETQPPAYPDAARIERSSGFAMVQAVVSAEGKVADVCLLYAIPEGLGFREEALRAVAFYRYRPGTRDGVPQSVLVNESVTWELK